LYRDQHLLDKASEQLTQAHDLIQELILIEDSPELQELLGVTLTIHGEVLNRQAQRHTPGQSRISDSRAALEKQQKAVRIFSQLERSISGPLLSSTRRKLMGTLTSMADTLETLELDTESQAAIAEARVIGNRALAAPPSVNSRLHQTYDGCEKRPR